MNQKPFFPRNPLPSISICSTHNTNPEKIVLPPITSLIGNFPAFDLAGTNAPIESTFPQANRQANLSISTPIQSPKFFTDPEDIEEHFNYQHPGDNPSNQESSPTFGKTPQYTLADDLLILKTINSYYGTAFHGRVPWSFWQTFKKVTGNKRSSSSLYHHWNGAMKRKYGSFLTQGRINECISWIETAIESGKPIQKKPTTNPVAPPSQTWPLPSMPIHPT